MQVNTEPKRNVNMQAGPWRTLAWHGIKHSQAKARRHTTNLLVLQLSSLGIHKRSEVSHQVKEIPR
jgi:hypothetical protein